MYDSYRKNMEDNKNIFQENNTKSQTQYSYSCISSLSVINIFVCFSDLLCWGEMPEANVLLYNHPLC